jgi:hypothetical protein
VSNSCKSRRHSNGLQKENSASQKVSGSCPNEVDVFNLPKSFSRTMALGSTQPLSEMSTRNILGGKGWPGLKADKLTAICEPIV